MFEVDLVGACGGMLSLALEEALGGGKAAVVGPAARKMPFLEWRPDYFTEPMKFSTEKEYDTIACIQCIPHLHGIELVNINNRIYGAKGHELVRLTDKQLREAKAFMKRTGIKLSRGESATLPLELHSFLSRVEGALKEGGTALFIDYGNPYIFGKLTKMKSSHSPLSRFMASTEAGKLHVVNFHPYLAKSPHPLRDSAALSVSRRLGYENRIIPWLDMQKSLSDTDKEALEPFMTPLFHVFSGWGDIVMDYKIAAGELMRQLSDEDGVTQLYATSFVLGSPLPADFSEKAGIRASEIANLPDVPPLFSVKLQKVY